MSAAFGMMSSFSASFTPSARDCSRPKGPFTLGPMRCCIRATTRRSNQMLNSVSSTRTTKISTALMMTSHHGSWPKPRQVVGCAGGRDQRQAGGEQPVDDHAGSLHGDRTADPGEAELGQDAAPELAGTQTTPSGRSATADRAA